MANTYLGLTDTYEQNESTRVAARVINMVASGNDVFKILTWQECNDKTGHKTKLITKLPDVTRRVLYGGIHSSTSKGQEVRDETANIATSSILDEDQYKGLSLDALKIRRQREFKLACQAIGKDIATQLFYGNRNVDPLQFNGLAMRYNTLSGEVGKQVIDAGGQGVDNTSIYIVKCGDDALSMIYPENSTMGISRIDMGLVPIPVPEAEGGGSFPGYLEYCKAFPGITLADYRSCSRIANISLADLAAGTVNLSDLLLEAVGMIYDIPSDIMSEKLLMERNLIDTARMGILCNRKMKIALQKYVNNKENTFFTPLNWDGVQVESFNGIPIYLCDQIIDAEERVV